MLNQIQAPEERPIYMQKPTTELIKKEPIFEKIIDKYGVPIIPVRQQGFETLALLILEQQVSIDSARHFMYFVF